MEAIAPSDSLSIFPLPFLSAFLGFNESISGLPVKAFTSAAVGWEGGGGGGVLKTDRLE